MGKNYQSELDHLPTTIDWATQFAIDPLRCAVETARNFPMVAVGSGGSLSVCHQLVLLHSAFASRLGAVHTPLEVMSNRYGRTASGWVISASGTNRDILKAFSALALSEVQHLAVLCGDAKSRLSAAAGKHRYADLIVASLPVGKDGFLATNSLLGFAVLLTRAYVEQFGTRAQQYDFALALRRLAKTPLNTLAKQTRALWNRETVIVLHGHTTKPGAVDIESKFTEAALGHVQLADYRNFAHGRHHWLAKRGKASGILAFIGSDDIELAEKTLQLIPREIPAVRINCRGGAAIESLQSLYLALHAASWAGHARGFDPGRPGVPAFGVKIYHLAYKTGSALEHDVLSARERVCIERKSARTIAELRAAGQLAAWCRHLTMTRQRVEQARFKAIVFDYDGTLVDARDRTRPVSGDVAQQLTRLLNGGISIGIATGRGKSVRSDLQTIIPKAHWNKILIGYYNGADCALLADTTHPDGRDECSDSLVAAAKALQHSSQLRAIAQITTRRWQITIEPRERLSENYIWDLVNEVLQPIDHSGIRIVQSSHSVDVLAPEISKEKLLRELALRVGCDTADILCIGDRGGWPGNDFDLLKGPLGLSVDAVSRDPASCWNLAPSGQRGIQATLTYCACIKVYGGTARIALTF